MRIFAGSLNLMIFSSYVPLSNYYVLCHSFYAGLSINDEACLLFLSFIHVPICVISCLWYVLYVQVIGTSGTPYMSTVRFLLLLSSVQILRWLYKQMYILFSLLKISSLQKENLENHHPIPRICVPVCCLLKDKWLIN